MDLTQRDPLMIRVLATDLAAIKSLSKTMLPESAMIRLSSVREKICGLRYKS